MPRGRRPPRFEDFMHTISPNMDVNTIDIYSSNFRLFTAWIIHSLGEDEATRFAEATRIITNAREEYGLSETNDEPWQYDIRLLVQWADSSLERYRTDRQRN